ncbi:lmo0937 family membrane protein [Mucilaginibacter corticis]|uniref:Lmo0937 family membrane protein n=1 Tax=Mucilaginibacter corticis TaxID=2597670 RepID=A0A556M8T2_9SPHI|nr:lmo0937 family membrane protein [Mucilaginibacter corticis]TSJ36338.1 lmo0937 family membrane protein [Mucilaginibacter corticis]
MRLQPYIVAVILIIGWAIETLAYPAPGLIHILLVIAIISLVERFLKRDTTTVQIRR